MDWLGLEECEAWRDSVADDDDEGNAVGCGEDEEASNDVRGVLAAGTGARGSEGVRGGASDWFDAADEVDSSDGGRLMGRASSLSCSSCDSSPDPWPPVEDEVLSCPSSDFAFPSSPSSLRRASLALAICCSRAASNLTSSVDG